jgi:hypothetical protein
VRNSILTSIVAVLALLVAHAADPAAQGPQRSYFGGSTLIVAVGPTPAVRIHIGSFPDPS